MLYIGVVGGTEIQRNALLEQYQNNRDSLFSRSKSLLVMMESDSIDNELLIDVLFYLSPVSKSEGDGKSSRGSMKWIRKLRDYSSFSIKKNVKGSKHLLIGDIPTYLSQIHKMDLDISVRFPGALDWQMTDSIEQAFKVGEQIEIPFIKSVIDQSKRERSAAAEDRIPFSEIATLIFQQAETTEWRLRSLLMKRRMSLSLMKSCAKDAEPAVLPVLQEPLRAGISQTFRSWHRLRD